MKIGSIGFSPNLPYKCDLKSNNANNEGSPLNSISRFGQLLSGVLSPNKKLSPEQEETMKKIMEKMLTPGKVALGVYSDGQNDLERVERRVFKEIQDEQKLGKDIDALIFYSSRTAAQMVSMKNGEFLKVENLGLPTQEPPNMSMPEILARFVCAFLLAHQNSQIKILDLADHGNAALGSFSNDIFPDKDEMSVDGIGQGIKKGVQMYKTLTGKDTYIDLVLFDQCLMGCAEVNHALIKTGVVKYAVSSPEVTFGLGSPAKIASILADMGMDNIDEFETNTAQMITDSIINEQSLDGFKKAPVGILVRCMPKEKIKAIEENRKKQVIQQNNILPLIPKNFEAGNRPLAAAGASPANLMTEELPEVPYAPLDFKEQEDGVAVAVKEFIEEVDKIVPEFGNDGNASYKLYPDGISKTDKNLYAYHLLRDTVFGVAGMGRFMDLIYRNLLSSEKKEFLKGMAALLCKLETGEALPQAWPKGLEFPFKPAVALFESYSMDKNLPEAIRQKAKNVIEAFKGRLVASSVNPTYLGVDYSDSPGETIAVPYSPFYVNFGEGGILWTAFAQKVMLQKFLSKIGALPPQEAALYIENEKTGKTSRLDPKRLSLK